MSDSPKPPTHTNALIHESSPYLLQHAHNPVDWRAWSEEAWEEARAQDKLVIVSIGYSACHWCHVMEHETFEDSAAAAFMNEHFINIKVDREERPDVDGVYMTAVQLMTKRGGWPLNAVCMPDGRPVYGGTYFPRERWLQALQSVLDTRAQDPERVEAYATQLTAGVQQAELVNVPPLEGSKSWGTSDAFGPADAQLLDDGIAQWKDNWDPKWGGNDRAPKFPIPTNLDFLLHYGTVRQDRQALDHVLNTLLKMERGGIHDHIGGGFARYSVDEKWHVPHFEKMLYDNAQLAGTYARAYQALVDASPSDRAALKRAALGIVDFMQREWSHPSGGFYSALDADSEGVEGKYYVWTAAELRAALNSEDFELIGTVYAIDEASRWTEEIPDANVLMRWKSDEALARSLNRTDETLHLELTRIHVQLRTLRDERVAPGLDDKILTAWTALAASGLVATGTAFERPEDIERARKAVDFLLESQRNENGRLRHVYHESTGPRITGMLDDYGSTIAACLDVYQATFDERYAEAARELCEVAIADFYDPAQGTFWFQSTQGETLFAQKQENDDSVMPSANAQMARNLFLLSQLFERQDWRILADRMLAGALDRASYWPSATHWAGLLLWRTEPFHEVVITAPNDEVVANAQHALQAQYRPQALYVGGASENIPLLRERQLGELAIFVCNDGRCQLPVASVEEIFKD
ncbi:thioredoxin domain-containing protein [Flavobacteriales bacterium]|nr:thioredoxin domain-containing protein [Flavobacteriales bacterium]